MSFLQWLDKIDKYLFLLINNDSDHRFLDNVMLLIRNPYTWIPLYGFILWYIFKTKRAKSLQFVAMSLMTFAITDSVSSGLLKPLFGRIRPCFEPELNGFMRNLIDCGGVYSFPSSHAANHFGLAAFWFWSVLLITGKKWNWLWIWALVICYAQVYVGKHYPFDIVAGAFFGWAVGSATAKLFHWWAFPHKHVFIKSLQENKEVNPA